MAAPASASAPGSAPPNSGVLGLGIGIGFGEAHASVGAGGAETGAAMLRDIEKLEAHLKAQSAEKAAIASEFNAKRREVAELTDDKQRLKDENTKYSLLVSQQTTMATQERQKANNAEKKDADARAAEKRATEELVAARTERESKLRETLRWKQEAEEMGKLRHHFERLCQQKDQDLKSARSELKDALEKQHGLALRQKDEEHKAEVERLKKEFEDAIVDLTVQNYSAQAGSSDGFKAKCAQLSEENKSLKAQLTALQVNASSARKVRFEGASPPPMSVSKVGGKRKPTRSTPVPGTGGGRKRRRARARAN